MPSGPPSRPMPDCLKPPNGLAKSSTAVELTATEPTCSRAATAHARSSSADHLLAGDLHVVVGSDEWGGDERPRAVGPLAAYQHGGAILLRAPQEPLDP